ncbi:MAG: metal ABC transporter ATP-binding protein [Deltaproteobacteria bacterium]|jgi:zinc transport system ATP-binding protein|nr:metal ABC transporter ATP-binding protein [Deltaproteobacteria bacterium]
MSLAESLTAPSSDASSANFVSPQKPILVSAADRHDWPPAIRLAGLGATLGEFEVLRDVTAQFPKGRQTIIIGPNGGGKSTLIHCLLGQIPHQGQIHFAPPKPRIGYVPQRPDFDRYLPLTSAEFLALGVTKRPIWLGLSGPIRRRIKAALDLVKAGALADKPLGGLSGGETQRVLLAAALLTDPDILILDEPATGVDVYGEQLLCELLEGFKNSFTVIMVSHDLATARAHGDWIVALNRRVIEEGPPEKIFQPTILSATFGLHQGLIFGQHPEPEPRKVEPPRSCCR